MVTYLKTLEPSPAEMEAAYLEYRRACSMILWRHAVSRDVLGALEQPKTAAELSEKMGFREEKVELVELMLRALARFGSIVRDGDGRYQAVSGFEPGQIDRSVLPRAISAKEVEQLMHSDSYRGMIDTLQLAENAAAAEFSADNLNVWTEFLSQPFYEYSRRASVEAVTYPGASVLDLGCGPGFGLVELADGVGPDGSVTGIEVSADFVEESKRRTADLSRVTVLHGNLDEGLPAQLGDGPFDGAILVGAMHFMHRHDVVLDSIARVLRPGGLLSVSYAYMTRGTPDQELMDMRFGFREPKTAAIEPEALVRTAAAAGLTVKDEFGLGCFGWYLFERE
jgi:ubiquinone/menaquinone biosynthesis C-methylase UbiE